jgi:ABC-type uncharacterized transport system permease subunit
MMHESAIFWLRVATVLYSIGLLHAILVLAKRKTFLFRYAQPAFTAAALFHFVSIVETTMAVGRLPVDNFFEAVSLCALLISGAYLILYWRYHFASLSLFIFPLVFLMSQLGAMETPVASWPNSGVRDAWLFAHVAAVLLGYVGLLVTALASIFYLIQERQLKSKRPERFFDRLPPLATLDNLITNSMTFGFVFITIGVIAGSAWAFIESGTSWIADPKIAISLFTWVFCLLMVFLRASAGLRGRKAALMAITVLGCSALTWAAHIGLRSLILR